MPVEAYAVAEKYSMGQPVPARVVSDRSAICGSRSSTKARRPTIGSSSTSTRAIARLTYRIGGVRYTREVFASHPAQAIVVRITRRRAREDHGLDVDRSAAGRDDARSRRTIG